MASRAITMAVWLFSINATFTILNFVNPFHSAVVVLTDPTMLNQTFSAASYNATAGIGVFGLLLEFIPIVNFFLSMLIGPLVLVPALLGLFGFTGIWVPVLSWGVWLVYGMFVVQLLTGRVFQVTK